MRKNKNMGQSMSKFSREYYEDHFILEKNRGHPGWVAQLVRALSRYTKFAGSITSQDIYENQPINV